MSRAGLGNRLDGHRDDAGTHHDAVRDAEFRDIDATQPGEVGRIVGVDDVDGGGDGIAHEQQLGSRIEGHDFRGGRPEAGRIRTEQREFEPIGCEGSL